MTCCEMYGYFIGLTLLFLAKARTEINMKTRGQMHIVNVGESILLSCEFSAVNFDMFKNPPVWKKEQQTEESIMNIMSRIQDPFMATRRFEVTHNNSPHSTYHSFDLRIQRMQREDSGNYTCEILGSETTVLAGVTHFIMVRVPVENLFITTSNETTRPGQMSERSLYFREGDENILRCISFGGYPPPLMRVYLACSHREHTRMEITEKLKWYQMPKLSGTRGLRNITQYSIRWSYDFDVLAQFDGCEVTCAVNLPGIQEHPVYANSTSAALHVQYAPIITCPNNTALPGDKNVYLICEVRAKPPAYSLRWLFDQRGTELTHGQQSGDYWVLGEPNRTASLRSRLYIRIVKEESFRSYTFIAENDIGVNSHSVSLAQKIIPTLPPSKRLTYSSNSATPIVEPWRGDGATKVTSRYLTTETLFMFSFIVNLLQKL